MIIFEEKNSEGNEMSQIDYDEAIKQWGSLEVKCVDEKRIAIGQNILNSISSYGSKVAQVNCTIRFIKKITCRFLYIKDELSIQLFTIFVM